MTEQYDDEINLRDYINVLIKRKVTVIVVFLICVITAALYSFTALDVYKVTQIFKPPTVGFSKYLYSSAKIKEAVEADLYDRAIKEALNLPLEERIEFEIVIPEDNGFFKTNLKAASQDIEKNKSILTELFNQLKKEFTPVIKIKKSKLENNISLKQNQIERKKEKIESSVKKINLIEKRISFMEVQSREAKKNTDILVDERTTFLEKVAEENRISSVLYTTTIQQAIGYFNQLHSQLNSLKNRRENLETAIQMLRGEIEDIKIRINELETNKKFIRNIRQLQAPMSSIHPIKPKKKQNIAIAAVIGLMLGVFIAFFREFWANSAGGGK